MMYVVTEYGEVNLKGKSVPEWAQALISIAHPDFREELARPTHYSCARRGPREKPIIGSRYTVPRAARATP